MILSRLVLNPRSREVIRDLSDCQEMHRTILSAFPQASGPARAEFGVLFRIDHPRDGTPALLVQSRERPDWSKLPPSYLAKPLEPADVKDVSEAYASLKSGATLRFRLRANPTRRIDTKSGPDGKRRNGKRVELKTDAQQFEWLDRKGAVHGFEVLSVRASNGIPNVRVNDEGKSRGHRANGTAREKNPLTFASVLFEGVLRVTDSDAFRLALEQGIGPAKAYGFGMLSVAPAEER
jgi:CRISPR system Cascade subunit CasE